MKIALVTPAPPRSRSGNRTTAGRWAQILRALGHRVEVSTDYAGQRCDCLVALHAYRSAGAVERYRLEHPGKPLILALTGTDLYRFIDTDPVPTLNTIRLADRLIGLHDRVRRAIPVDARAKLRIIYQSSSFRLARVETQSRHFDICVVGHLRHEKDPFRAAYAVRDLPSESRIRVCHYGKAHDEVHARAALDEQIMNPRYQWIGEIPRWKLNRVYARAHLMVISSRMEGGANVISEAVTAGLPILASRIDGNVGLLGEDYPGYFPAESTEALAALMARAESDAGFLAHLRLACRALAGKFSPARELRAWRSLLTDLS